MLQEKAGEIAGKIWKALDGTEGMTVKQIKKVTKSIDKDLYLGFGWLLREDKLSVTEVEGELFVKLKWLSDNQAFAEKMRADTYMSVAHFFYYLLLFCIFAHLFLRLFIKYSIYYIANEEYP